mmetsp:Transcript_32581/g.97012  ORF Transcript_32581/g.97012 Transcript_32581/m.97012 type:complete len:262 (+) Transcript_32581:611-1396(+)
MVFSRQSHFMPVSSVSTYLPPATAESPEKATEKLSLPSVTPLPSAAISSSFAFSSLLSASGSFLSTTTKVVGIVTSDASKMPLSSTSHVRRSSRLFSMLSSMTTTSISVCLRCSSPCRVCSSLISRSSSSTFSCGSTWPPSLPVRKKTCSRASLTDSRADGSRCSSLLTRSRAAGSPTFSSRSTTTPGCVPHACSMRIAAPEAQSSSRVNGTSGSPASSTKASTPSDHASTFSDACTSSSEYGRPPNTGLPPSAMRNDFTM